MTGEKASNHPSKNNIDKIFVLDDIKMIERGFIIIQPEAEYFVDDILRRMVYTFTGPPFRRHPDCYWMVLE